MKFSHLTRIYIQAPLIINDKIDINCKLYEYLIKVLRLKVKDNLRIFNEYNGEFLTEITEIKKSSVQILIKSYLRCESSIISSKLTLAISIIKSHKMLDAINMAVQLGVDEIVPVIAARSQNHQINYKKIAKVILEATQQSERLTPSNLLSAMPFGELVKSDHVIIYANENENPKKMVTSINVEWHQQNIMLLIGPEGGFTDHELQLLSAMPNSHSISLGKNIFRTETAAVAALAQVLLFRT